ncbi:hypothetical protein BN8_03256 [Fibrisoma limi BUZ 3]|uniref:Uncharacterized protein n=1 Tax=Fibrisoma limi BUZ 3 TaxID=1185876 RepID=I2GJN7_9BACT|nr:hypothetical protein BN8_03256 [Fibrisoma limi BUZ 3]
MVEGNYLSKIRIALQSTLLFIDYSVQTVHCVLISHSQWPQGITYAAGTNHTYQMPVAGRAVSGNIALQHSLLPIQRGVNQNRRLIN